MNRHPIFHRILQARGVKANERMDYPLCDLLDPEKIRHLDDAAKLLAACMQEQGRIVIFGDYDADGATSTALCVKALRLMGHGSVSYLMPDRLTDGYGLSLSAAERLIEQKPDCIVTVDNGISSLEGIARLREEQIAVIVTDHHLAAGALPDASVIVNQNAWPDETEGRNLAGVGVSFYLMLALRSVLRQLHWFQPKNSEPNLAACLDLVALGSIADLVVLDYQNRILVHEGLRRIRAGACSEGLKALVQVSGKSIEHLTTTDIAYAIAPKINAAGRLEDMTVGVECLLSEDRETALQRANTLNEINQLRKQIQQKMTAEAEQQIEHHPQEMGDTQRSIVLYQADWHEGIVGIIAAKLKEQHHRPCIVFTDAAGGELKGSGRSIAGIHLRDMLDVVQQRNPGMILKFGGHAMAAGLSLQPDQLDDFSRCFEKTLTECIDPDCFHLHAACDGELDGEYLNLDFARDLQSLSPWGQGFPNPSFSGEFAVLQQQIFAHKHLKFTLDNSHSGLQPSVEAIYFFPPSALLNTNCTRIHIHYELNINHFRGQDSFRLLIRQILPEKD